jgi:hypothetical protein
VKREIFLPEPPLRWRCHLDLYRYKKAIRFKSRKERDKALDLLWNDDEFFGMPYEIAVSQMLVVPAESIPFFWKKGVKFTIYDVVSGRSSSTEGEQMPPKARPRR